MTLDEVATLCRNEFPHLVRAVLLADPRRGRIRLSLIDATFIDIHQNPDGRYSYHWQREDGSFRFNNAPHFDQIETAPHHLHLADGSVVPSGVQGVSEEDVKQVLRFVEAKLREASGGG